MLDDTRDPPATPPLRPLSDLVAELTELAAHVHAAIFRMLCLIRELDEREGWELWGARSTAHYLAWRLGLGLGAAREQVRVARALGRLPLTSDALRDARISYAKARALTRVATPENEQTLLEVALGGNAEHVERVVRAYRRAAATEERERTGELHRQRRLVAWYDDDGMLRVEARLPPEQGALFLKALEAAQERLFPELRESAGAGSSAGEPQPTTPSPASTLGAAVGPEAATESSSAPPAFSGPAVPRALVRAGCELRADALAALAEAALGHGLDGQPGTCHHEVVVHVDAEVLADPDQPGACAVEGGPSVPAGTCRRLACDAAVVVMRHGEDGALLDVGRRQRSVPPAMRRALVARDGGCQFPGCECTRFVQAHHLQHWADGGRTSLDNALLLCTHHHRLVHEGGFSVERGASGRVLFRDPAGREVERVPLLPPVGSGGSPGDDVLPGLRSVSARSGLVFDGESGLPEWFGEPLTRDGLQWVVAGLLQLDRDAAGSGLA